MKRTILAVMMLLASTAVFAQTAPVKKAPWAHGTTEYIAQGHAVRDQAGDRWNWDFTGGWLPYVSDRTQVGALASFRGGTGGTGQAAGPAYRYRLRRLRYGEVFAGGSLQVTSGDLTTEAAALGAAEFGYGLYVGQSSKVTFALNLTRPIKPNDPTTDSGAPLKQAGFTIGISLGHSAASKVN